MIGLLIDEWRNLGPIAWAEHSYGWIAENGKSIKLAEWQRAVLSEYWQRRETVSTLFISSVKKSGKTLLNSLLTCWRWLTIDAPKVHYVVGNDQDQSAELQITMIGAMCQRHPILRRFVKVTRNELTFEPTGARLVALPMDYRGSAGGNFATVSLTELWAFLYESGVRLYEELTPIPMVDCLRVVDSYAGFEQESQLLYQVWNRGAAGKRINGDWPIYLVGQQLSYIHQGDDAQRRCWRGDDAQREAYYQEQRETLRENTYRRLHLNEWVSSEDAFVTAELWDALVLAGYRCPAADRSIRLTVGVDLAVKRDHAAAVSVYRRDGLTYLGPYRIWKPPVDLSAVEDYLADLARGFSISAWADPYQAQHLIQRLQKRGMRIREFAQTIPNLTRAGNALFDAIRQGQLVIYEGAKDLRAHVLNARAKETDRGLRLVKGKSTKKIDAAIALAMAVAETQQRRSAWFDFSQSEDPNLSRAERWELRQQRAHERQEEDFERWKHGD